MRFKWFPRYSIDHVTRFGKQQLKAPDLCSSSQEKTIWIWMMRTSKLLHWSRRSYDLLGPPAGRFAFGVATHCACSVLMGETAEQMLETIGLCDFKGEEERDS